MALVLSDRIKETTTTTGTIPYVLGGAASGFETFTANLSNGDTTYYCCTDGTDFEVGLGTYASTGTKLNRTTIISSSNSNNAVNWSSGTRDIFCTLPGSKAVVLDANGALSTGITIQDEGSGLSTTATTLNFVGSGIVASGTGATKTITVTGGGIGTSTANYFDAHTSSDSSALTSSFATIDFDTIRYNSSGSVFSESAGEVTMTTTGIHRFHTDVTTKITSGSARSDCEIELQRKPSGGSFSQIAGSTAITYNRISARGEQTSSIDILYNVTSGDTYRVVAKRQGGTDTIVVQGGAARFNISSVGANPSVATTAADDLTAGDAAVNLTTTSGNITIDAQGNDTDIILKGTDSDGSGVITMLFLDGSANGDATFSGKIVSPNGIESSSYFWMKNDGNVALYGGANFEVALTHVHNTGFKLTNGGTGTPAVELQFVDSNEAIGSDGTNLKLTSGGNEITVPNSGADTMTLNAATQTLTNKTLTSPTINGFSGTGNGSITGDLTLSGTLKLSGTGGPLINTTASLGTSDVSLLRASTAESGTHGFTIKYMGSRSGNENSFSLFMDNQQSTDVEAITVFQDGKVGINNTSPSAPLDVSGDAEITGTLTVGATNGNQTLNVASHDLVDGGLQLAGTLVTASATEINKLDGVTASTTELNYVDVTTLGTVQASKAVTADANGDVLFPDDENLFVGTHSDLKIFHNGSNSFIREQGTGNLKLQATNLSLELGDGTLLLDTNNSTNAVQLYDNGELRLRTTDTGIDVLADDDDNSSDNTANIRIVSEGTNEIVTLRSNNGVASYIIRNGSSHGQHLFQSFNGTDTTNLLRLTTTGHTFEQGVTVTGDLTTTADIELGHASDTTIARASAGVVTIEGNTVLTTGNSDAPSTTTSSGDADFVLVDDNGTMKKITPANLGITSGGASKGFAVAMAIAL